MRRIERIGGALLLALTSACGGGRVPDAGDAAVDASTLEPPNHPGCLDDSDWRMDFIDGPSMYSASNARAFLNDAGELRVLMWSSSTAPLTLFVRQSDGSLVRHDMPVDLMPDLPHIMAAASSPDGEVAVLISLRLLGGEPAHAVVSWNGVDWILGEPQLEGPGTEFPDFVSSGRSCLQGSTGMHRYEEYFGSTGSDSMAVHMFRFDVEGATSLGIFPNDFLGCQTTNSGLHVRARADSGSGPGGAYTFWDFADTSGSWRVVGEVGTTRTVKPAFGAPLYDSELGLRVLGVDTVPSPHATTPDDPEQVDILLYDAPTDGTDTRSRVDHLGWSRPRFAGDPSFTLLDQLHVVTDAGGMQHAAYERQGFEGSPCESCDAPPDVEGEYGLRYAARTDAGWMRKDLLWTHTEPNVFDQPLEILDLAAWHGEIHILVSLHEDGLGSDPGFIFQSGPGEVAMAQGLYDIHSTGCAYR